MRRESGPIYARIEQDLREAIGKGDLPVGARVPSEADLGRRYGVARMTARQALGNMVDAGLLVRRRGVGTFVAQDKVARVAGRLLGFHEDALAHGLDPVTQVLSQSDGAAGAADAVLLGCEEDDPVWRVERLRFHGAEPIGLNTVVLAPSFVRAFAEVDFAGSLYQAAEEVLGLAVTEAVATVEAVTAPRDASERLGVPRGSALLRTTRLNLLQDGRPLAITRTLYRGDRYYLSLTIRKDPAGMVE